MMHRTQLSIDAELIARARRRASELGISLAEYVRRLLARDLNEARPQRDISAIFDLGDSGGSNIARDKDAMIDDAVSSLHESRKRPRSAA